MLRVHFSASMHLWRDLSDLKSRTTPMPHSVAAALDSLYRNVVRAPSLPFVISSRATDDKQLRSGSLFQSSCGQAHYHYSFWCFSIVKNPSSLVDASVVHFLLQCVL